MTPSDVMFTIVLLLCLLFGVWIAVTSMPSYQNRKRKNYKSRLFIRQYFSLHPIQEVRVIKFYEDGRGENGVYRLVYIGNSPKKVSWVDEDDFLHRINERIIEEYIGKTFNLREYGLDFSTKDGVVVVGVYRREGQVC